MADAGYLTIGKVVKRLQSTYPDLTVSKVRYLEDEGLLNPGRTPGGYRLYTSRDIKRLENILYLQKNRFLPLQVIKEELDALDKGEVATGMSVMDAYPQAPMDDEETLSKFHAIDRVPELLGVSIAFVQQLAQFNIISLKRSRKGRDLVDGRDFPLIRAADALSRYGLEPRNLRQYVTAANRESAMFEQALSIYRPRTGDMNEEQRRQYEQAFKIILAQTETIRSTLLKRNLGIF